MNHRSTRASTRAATLLALAALAAPGAQAQDVSRIVAVTLYSSGGEAVVERQLKTPGGTRHVVVDCLPPNFQASTLQVDGAGDASLRVGDVHTEALTPAESRACAQGPLQARLRALDDQRTALKSQQDADQLALDYLRRWNGGNGPEATAPHASAPARALPAAEPLRRSALELLADQARVATQLVELDKQAATLQKSARHAPDGNWVTLRFDVSTAAAGTLRLRYQAAAAHWKVFYRAALDTTASTLRLERLAEITQASGEDWTDVGVTLAMTNSDRRSGPRLPESWTLHMPPPLPKPGASSDSFNRVQRVEITGSSISRFDTLPNPEVRIDRTPVAQMGAEENEWGTQFRAARPMSLPSDGETHTLPLDARTVAVKPRVRVVPLESLAAWVTVDMPKLAGSWPAGDLQKWRDGTLIGDQRDWYPGDEDETALYFGRDDRVHVSVQRPASMSESAGLFGGQTRSAWGSIWVVHNEHASAQVVELIDSAPVSQDEQIKVVSKYDPPPTTVDWQHTPGVDAWLMTLAPDQTRQVSVSHQVTYPKGARIGHLPVAPDDAP